MPLPDGSCESCSPSCTSLFDVVASVASVAYEAVACQLDQDACDKFTGFVSHGEPNHPDGDYVAAWIARVYAQDRNQNTGAGLVFPLPVVEIGLKLCETGYPTIGGDGPPPFTALHNASMHSYSHAEAMMRRIYASVGKGAKPGILAECGWQGMTPLVAARPSGGIVTWTMSISLRAPT